MNTAKSGSLELRSVLRVLFKRKSEILTVWCLCIFAITAYSLLSKPTYETTARVLIKMGRENIYVLPLLATKELSPVVSSNQEEQINSEIEILKSRLLAERVLKSLGLTVIYPDLASTRYSLSDIFFDVKDSSKSSETTQNEALRKLQKNLKVEGVKKSNVINVSFRHFDPVVAARVVNALVTFYLDHHLHVHQDSPLEFFHEQSATLENELRKAEVALEAYKKQRKVISPDEQKRLLLNEQSALRADLNRTLSLEAETVSRINQLRRQLERTPKDVSFEKEIDSNQSVISGLQAKLVELKTRENELRNKYREQSLLVQDVRNQIKVLEPMLAEQEAKHYVKTRSGPNVIYQTILQELFRSEAELNALRAKKERQVAHLASYQSELEELNQAESGFESLRQQVELSRKNYQLYQTRFQESRISNAMDNDKISNVSVIEPASPPLKPISPKVFLNIVLSVLAGGIAALGLASWLEYMDNRIETDEDVELFLGALPVLASIPRHERKKLAASSSPQPS